MRAIILSLGWIAISLSGERSLAADIYKLEDKFQKACDAGDPKGCDELGKIELKLGNKATARALFDKACDQGGQVGCLHKKSFQEMADAQRKLTPEKYCRTDISQDLFSAVYDTRSTTDITRGDCFLIRHGVLRVVQAVPGGILARPSVIDPYLSSRVIFIKTKRAYVDEDSVGEMLVVSTGPFKYDSFGGPRTVHSFMETK